MRVLLPVDDRLYICRRHGEAAILEAQQVFEQHLHAERQARDVAQLARGLVERIISISLAADVQRRAGSKRVVARGRHRIARSEAHTSELQSLMRHSYVVFGLKKN